MYYDFTVKVPDEKGKIIIKPKGRTSYVLYQYGQDYVPEKKYTVPKRTIIGKLSSHDRSLMYPNEKYAEFFPDRGAPEGLPEAYRCSCLDIGAYMVIQKILRELGLPALLDRWFGPDAGLLTDLASYLAINAENAARYYSDYAFRHPLSSEGMRIRSDGEICRLLRSVRQEQVTGFLDDWNKKLDHDQRVYISCGPTDRDCRAGDGGGLPVPSLVLAFGGTDRVPLFYHLCKGPMTDGPGLPCMAGEAAGYGYKDIGFIVGREFFSEDNIRRLDEGHYPFIIMMKEHGTLFSSLVKDNTRTFETSRDCSIRAYKVYGKTVKGRLYDDDGRDRYFHLYFSASRQASEREAVEQIVESQKRSLESHLGKTVEKEKYEKYFKLYHDGDGNLSSFEEKAGAVREALDLCGYSCLVSSEEMTAGEAIKLYKSRESAAGLFGVDRPFTGSEDAEFRTLEETAAEMFVGFLALTVRSRIRAQLGDTAARRAPELNYMTVPAAVLELERIQLRQMDNGKYRLASAVTEKQKAILGAFGITESNAREQAAEVARILQEYQPPVPSGPGPGGEDFGSGGDGRTG